MTINKVEGQTLDQVGIFLFELVFSYGQLYAALSCTRISENLKIVTKSVNNEEESNFTTKNIHLMSCKELEYFNVILASVLSTFLLKLRYSYMSIFFDDNYD